LKYWCIYFKIKFCGYRLRLKFNSNDCGKRLRLIFDANVSGQNLSVRFKANIMDMFYGRGLNTWLEDKLW
jgi:hypothetical protein